MFPHGIAYTMYSLSGLIHIQHYTERTLSVQYQQSHYLLLNHNYRRRHRHLHLGLWRCFRRHNPPSHRHPLPHKRCCLLAIADQLRQIRQNCQRLPRHHLHRQDQIVIRYPHLFRSLLSMFLQVDSYHIHFHLRLNLHCLRNTQQRLHSHPQ